MLNPTYHLAYWMAAASAVAVFQTLNHINPNFSAAVRVLMGPLTAGTLCSAFMWQRRAKSTGLALGIHQAAVAYLLVAIGSIADYFQIPGEQSSKPTALIHALMAFVTVGFLESLRQNRRDIEPTTFFLLHRGPRTELLQYSWWHFRAYLGSTIICNAFLIAILALTERLLNQTSGTSLKQVIPYWGWERMHVQGRLGSVVAAYFLGGPFADMAETMFYVLCRKFVPHLDGPLGWMPKQIPLTSSLTYPIPVVNTELAAAAFFWVSRVLIVVDRDQTGGSVWDKGIVYGVLDILGG